jgi:hypothetical protein
MVVRIEVTPTSTNPFVSAFEDFFRMLDLYARLPVNEKIHYVRLAEKAELIGTLPTPRPPPFAAQASVLMNQSTHVLERRR